MWSRIVCVTNKSVRTLATSIPVTEEIRPIGLIVTTNFAGRDVTWDGVDTVATPDATGSGHPESFI